MKFLNGHTVRVQVREVEMLLSYEAMGFCDHRKSAPDKQWELLRSFAKTSGVMDWSHTDADPKNQKRREDLAKGLKTFFGLHDDPFEPFDDGRGKGWRAKFWLADET